MSEHEDPERKYLIALLIVVGSIIFVLSSIGAFQVLSWIWKPL